MALNYLRNPSKSLNKYWCSNKGANQTKVVLDNKVSMNSTWTRPVRHQWRWSWMTKCIWLIKPRNFECVPLNLLGRLICSSFGWGCVVETHSKEIKTWLVYKWAIDSWSVWFSYSKFLRTAMISSMEVDMIMNIMKYETNKRWVVHNLS